MTESARTGSVTIVRRSTAAVVEGAILNLDLSAEGKRPELADGDDITIPSLEDFLPVVYVEGAIAPSTPGNTFVPSAPIVQSNNAFSPNTTIAQATAPQPIHLNSRTRRGRALLPRRATKHIHFKCRAGQCSRPNLLLRAGQCSRPNLLFRRP